jgi:hypothetical protein
MITIEKTFSSSYTASEDTLFFDIETTGLSRQYHRVYLIGCAHFINGSWKLLQWLAESKVEEIQVLEAFFAYARSFYTIIHFNGKRFDLPFVDARSIPYELENPLKRMHSIDLYQVAKSLQPILGLENVKQKTVEDFLHITRKDQFSGGELILVFDSFCKTHSEDDKYLLLIHNEEDVIGMTKLLALKEYKNYIQSTFLFVDVCHKKDCISLQYQTDASLPHAFKNHSRFFTLEANSYQLTLYLPILQLELKHFFTDTKNYYYFPEQDMAIHKSVAMFMDGEKKKCNKQNCYIRHQGAFIPQPDKIITPEFKKELKSPILYAPYKPELFQNEEHSRLFLQSILTLR